MRYSNVYESFFDFLKDKKEKERKGIINRIQNFLQNNPQYGYDAQFLLPGLCPLKKMAESVVISEKYLRNLIKDINYDSIKLFRLKSKIWTGDVVALMPTENSKDRMIPKSFKASIDSFSDYLQDFDNYPKRRKYTKRYSYEDPLHYRRRTNRYVSESFFSDFMSWMKDGSAKKDDINFENALFQITHFLVKYPGYDYDKQNDIPGFIFLTTLAQSIQIPYDSLIEVFKQNKFENAEIVNFKMDGIEGPIVVFGKPSVERKTQWDSWNAELQSKSEEEIESIAFVASDVEADIKQEAMVTQKPQTTDIQSDITPEVKVNVDVIDESKKEKIIQATIESLMTVFNKVKKDSLNISQKTLLNLFDRMSVENNTKVIKEFISSLFKNNAEYLKNSSFSNELFIESNNEKILKADLNENTIGIKLSNFIWTDTPIIKTLIEYYQTSSDISNDVTELETEETLEPEVKVREISNTENIVRMSQFLKMVLKSLKEKISTISTGSLMDMKVNSILKDSNWDEQVTLAIKSIIQDFPTFSSKDKNKLSTVFIEYKDNPNTYFITQDLDSATPIFTDYLINDIPDIFAKTIEESI